MAGINCQDPQFSHEMHYPGEVRHNMNHGGTQRPGQDERAHHHTIAKDRLIEHTMRTERNDHLGGSVNVVFAPGIIGNSKHKIDFPNPVSHVGKNPAKHVAKQPHKARPKGEHKGGL